MSLPDDKRLYQVIAGTWPSRATLQVGPWTLRDGGNGGSRVSSTTADGPWAPSDFPLAEEACAGLGQPSLFMIRAGEEALDDALAERGYVIKDPVNLYAAPVEAIATERPPPITAFTVWPALAAQKEVWAAGGIGAGRLAVMDRAPMPKTTLMGRADDRVAGTVFVGIHDDCAMIHALEITASARRKGLARHLTRAAAFWARDNGALWLTLVTTKANTAANGLYTSLGMTLVGHYHYRIKPEAP